MRAIAAALLALCTASSAFAQDSVYDRGGSVPRCGSLVARTPFAARFIGSTDGWGLGPSGGGANAPLSGNGGGSILSGIKSAEDVLVAAVIAAAALPLVVYAVDDDARRDIQQCWAMPSETFELSGGSLLGKSDWVGLMKMRGSLAAGVIGFDVAGETSRDYFGYRALEASMLLRAPPKQHLDIAISGGFRYVELGGLVQRGVELSLPHRYLPLREDALDQGFSIEVRPGVILHQGGPDFRLDAGLGFPLTEYLKLYAGTRFFSFAGTVQTGLQFGISAGG